MSQSKTKATMRNNIRRIRPVGMRSAMLLAQAILIGTILFLSTFSSCDAFVVPNHLPVRPPTKAVDFNSQPLGLQKGRKIKSRLYAAADLPDISSMRAGEIRKELESYGISTKSFLEKKEMVAALEKARAEGKTPINGGTQASTSSSGSSSSAGSSEGGGGASRDEKLKAEMEKCKSMKVGELKKELQDLGISTKSFFEKSEFVKALAEARVDGKKKTAGQGFGGGAGRGTQEREEKYDPSYRDVVMQKFQYDPRDPRVRGQLIDIQLGR